MEKLPFASAASNRSGPPIGLPNALRIGRPSTPSTRPRNTDELPASAAEGTLIKSAASKTMVFFILVIRGMVLIAASRAMVFIADLRPGAAAQQADHGSALVQYPKP